MFSPQSVSVSILCVVLLSLGVFVFRREPQASVNRLFAFSMCSIAGWIGSISVALSTGDLSSTATFGRIAFAFASAIPFSLLWMFEAFPISRPSRLRVLILPGSACVFFVFLSFTKWIVEGATAGSERPNFSYGAFHPLFGVYFLLTFLFALYRLWKKNLSATGIRKLQLRYLLLGILIGGIGAITTNLLIPLVWKTSRYSTLGPYFSLVVAGFAAHAIIRHRLMDIKVVIRKGVIYSSAVAVAVSLFITLAMLFRTAAGYESHTMPLSLALAMGTGMAICFNPLKDIVQASLSRYLYRQPYDYQRTVREASRRISTILELDSVLSFLADVIERTFKVEMVAVLLRDDARYSFTPQLLYRSPRWEYPPLEPQAFGTAPLADALRRGRRLLVREEILSLPDATVPTSAAEQMRVIGAEVAIPFLHEATLSGFLLVGAKLSGDPYFSEDIDLLSTLAAQADIAIKNAQLYRQVVLVNDYIENILSTIESGVIAVAPDETVTLFNAAAGRMTGIDPATIKGQPLRDIPGAVPEALRATTSDGQPRAQVEGLVQDVSGRLTPIICSTSVLRDRANVTLGSVAVFSDLTRLHELEGEKRRAERLASIGAFASGITHEIKNPLVAIKTFAELLPERFNDDEFRRDFSKIVIQEIERIDELIARLRGMATPESRRTIVNIRPSIQETLALLRGQMEQARVSLSVTYGDHLPLVEADTAQLRQLFLNLCMNSLEAMQAGGRLDIRVDSRSDDNRRVLRITVSDTGTGIPSHLLEKVFDPFVTTKPQGSGLGLSICRGIVDAHRATIQAINNTDGRGATIILEFPETRPAEAVLPSA